MKAKNAKNHQNYFFQPEIEENFELKYVIIVLGQKVSDQDTENRSWRMLK